MPRAMSPPYVYWISRAEMHISRAEMHMSRAEMHISRAEMPTTSNDCHIYRVLLGEQGSC